MQRTDVGVALGNGQELVKYTIAYTDVTASNSVQTIYLPTNPGGNAVQVPTSTAPPNAANFQIPQAGWIYYVKIHQTSAWTGSGSTLTMSLGKLGSSNTWITPAVNINTNVSDTTVSETFSVPSGQISAWGVTATFTYSVALLSSLNQGLVDIYLGYMNVSSPGE
jgi:hypothetical protein